MEIAINGGYTAFKARNAHHQTLIASVIGTPDQTRFSVTAPENSIELITPYHVLVGEAALTQSAQTQRREDRGWISSREWYALFTAALSELTPGSVDCQIVSGLPLSFYSDKDILRDRLLGEHHIQRAGRRAQTFHVSEARIIPEPFGTVLDAALDQRGRVANPDLATGTVGVIDIGGKTTNLLAVTRLAEVRYESASINVGGWDVVRRVRTWLTETCPNLDPRDHQIQTAVIQHHIRYYGERVDLTPVIEDILPPLADQIIATASQLWNGGAHLDTIVVTGGGALLLGDHILPAFPHARVVADPIFANVNGFWKFARYLWA